MGLGQVGSFFVAWVGLATSWVWIISPKNPNFFPSGHKKSQQFGSKNTRIKDESALIYYGSEVCLSLVTANLYINARYSFDPRKNLVLYISVLSFFVSE